MIERDSAAGLATALFVLALWHEPRHEPIVQDMNQDMNQFDWERERERDRETLRESLRERPSSGLGSGLYSSSCYCSSSSSSSSSSRQLSWKVSVLDLIIRVWVRQVDRCYLLHTSNRCGYFECDWPFPAPGVCRHHTVGIASFCFRPWPLIPLGHWCIRCSARACSWRRSCTPLRSHSEFAYRRCRKKAAVDGLFVFNHQKLMTCIMPMREHKKKEPNLGICPWRIYMPAQINLGSLIRV